MSQTNPAPEYLREKVCCFYCGEQIARRGEDFSRDHITPKSKGGPDAPGNLVPCCVSCNRAKGNKHWSEFVRTLPVARQEMIAIALRGHDKQFPFDGRAPTPEPKLVPQRKAKRPAKIPPSVNDRASLAAKSMAENLLRQSGEPRGKDVAWFKARIHEALELVGGGQLLEAALLLNAVASLPAKCLPGHDPEGAAMMLKERIERERPFRTRFFEQDGIPHVVGKAAR